jgi:hypothetical protein
MSHHLLPAAVRALLAILLLPIVGGSVAVAQSGGPFDLTWYSVDGGGQTSPPSGRSTGGSFALSGTIGQPDAGPPLGGGTFGLGGGFWTGGATAPYRVYLPIVMREP